MKLGFVGDMIFGDQPVTFGYGFDSLHQGELFFDCLKNVNDKLQVFDFVVANFEAVIKPRPENATVDEWSMCTTEKAAEVLYNANIRVVSLANNHTMDYGEEYYNETRNALKNKSIHIIGDKDVPFCIVSVDGLDAAFIAASYLPESSETALYWHNPSVEEWEVQIQKIREISPGAKIFACIHWGNEFVQGVNQSQITIAEGLGRLDIEAVVGHHPHILQSPATVNNTPVYFSLGNFISDYWQARLRKTIILSVDLTTADCTYQSLDCYIDERGCPEYVKTTSLTFPDVRLRPVSVNEINKARYQMRMEYIIHIARNFRRIKGKKAMLAWLFERLGYFVKYAR